MNSRYNIGKVLYKVDSYVDRCQETIYTQNIISDNQIVKDELTIGEGSDDSIVKISQSTNPSTGELEGNIETPNIKITKELKFEGDNNTTIDNSGINADTIYVNNLYTDNYNPTNLKTQNIVIVDEHEQETGTKINKDGIEADIVKAQNLDVENLNIDVLVFKNEEETIKTTINKNGITIENDGKTIELKDGDFIIGDKKINDIQKLNTQTEEEESDDYKLTTKAYVDYKINEAITGGLESIDVNIIKSKDSDKKVDVYADLILKDDNNHQYDINAGNIIGNNIIGTYKSNSSDNPNVLINDTGITLKDKKITDIDKLDTETEKNNIIPTTAKVEKLIRDIDLTNYVTKSDSSKLIFDNESNSFNGSFNGSLITSSISINNKNPITDTTAENNSTEEKDNVLATQYYVDSKEINLEGYSKTVIITNEDNEITAKKLIMKKTNELTKKITIENIMSSNDSEHNNTLTTKGYNDDTYASKSGYNLFSGNNTFSNNVIFNNGLSTASEKVLINNDGITLDGKKLISVIDKDNDDDVKNKKLYTAKKIDALLDDKADISDIPDVSDFITKEVDNLTNYYTKNNSDDRYVLKTEDNEISGNNTFSGTNTFTKAINADSGITTSSDDLSLSLSSKSGNINFGNNTTLTTSSNVETFTTNNLIGNYKSNSTNPSVSITNNTEIGAVILKIQNNETSTLNITNTGKLTATELKTNIINVSNITSDNNIVEIDNTLKTDNINSTSSNNQTLNIRAPNNYPGDEQIQDTNEYAINLGYNTNLKTKQIQEDNKYVYKDTFKTDNLEAEELIIKEIEVLPGGIFSNQPIEVGTITNNNNNEQKTAYAGLYPEGHIKVVNGNNNIVDIYKNNNNNNTYGKIDIYNNTTPNITLDGNNGTITTKQINLPMKSSDTKIIEKVSDNYDNHNKDITLATEAYVDHAISGGGDLVGNYKSSSDKPNVEIDSTHGIKVSNSNTSTLTINTDGDITTSGIIRGNYQSASSNPNISINNTNGITTKYSINEPNIITLDDTINTYKGITYTFDTNTNTASIIGIDMTNEQSIIIPRYIIKKSIYYMVNNINISDNTKRIYKDYGYIYIPDTIQPDTIQINTIDSLLNEYVQTGEPHKVLINMPINLYCKYLLNLSNDKSYTKLTIILRENKQNIYNISNNTHKTDAFIINLSSVKSIYLEKNKTKITTLFNEYASCYPDKFKNMPSEHYDILSNLEKDINDKLIKEYNKKMVYLKNGFTSSLPDGASQDIISYNPYYNETKGGNVQVFNTELNNVIINTGTEFKYKYNFQDDNNYTTIDLTGITNIDYEFQHSFVMNETLYGIEIQTNYINIKPLWSFNPNIKLTDTYSINVGAQGACNALYVYPYVILYTNNSSPAPSPQSEYQYLKLYYSTNLLYWQSIILEVNSITKLYYVNNKNITNLQEQNLQFTSENILIINKKGNEYYIYPSYTKEELFMRM